MAGTRHSRRLIAPGTQTLLSNTPRLAFIFSTRERKKCFQTQERNIHDQIFSLSFIAGGHKTDGQHTGHKTKQHHTNHDNISPAFPTVVFIRFETLAAVGTRQSVCKLAQTLVLQLERDIDTKHCLSAVCL